MTIPSHLWLAARSLYNELQWKNYPGFRAWVLSIATDKSISEKDANEILSRFPDPRPSRPRGWEQEDGVEAYLRDPPDSEPLANVEYRGWITPDVADTLRLPLPTLRDIHEISDADALGEIQENALHILGRCNDPRAWGENHQGLVYGMVQSGKTASMIQVILMAKKAGYRLFIILAGDKTSLREQTQERINHAFDLDNGLNTDALVQSPTWERDFGQTSGGYANNFRYLDRFVRARSKDWATVIVIKKQTDHLKELVDQIDTLHTRLEKDGRDLGEAYPTLILDDEADYASQNTDVPGSGNPIHRAIVALRESLPRNTYIGYTATPQACLSADTKDMVGYPRDFFWLLEPVMEREGNDMRSRTYLGAWEVLTEFDSLLIHKMARDEWPHYEKDSKGRPLGVYVPSKGRGPGEIVPRTQGVRLVEIETTYLDDVLKGARPRMSALRDALLDFIIGCGVKWWREWRKAGGGELPSLSRIVRDYPYHAAMVHLSLTQPNQERIQALVQAQWHEVIAIRREFKPTRSPVHHPFRERWRLQCERTEALLRTKPPPYGEVSYFIDQCIKITEEPINDHREHPYHPYQGSPFVYLLNSSDDGMELFYGGRCAPEIRAKKAAIVVGGNILSRGLTIEGLSVSIFGRTAQMPMGDTSLQMGRWLGHKMSYLDTISIFLQDQTREVLWQIAEADRYLRQQIKDAIVHGHPPTRVLLEMRNSRFFRITSPSKSTFLQGDGGGIGFAGKMAMLNQPSFESDDIVQNLAHLRTFFEGRTGSPVHHRATLYRNIPPRHLLDFFDGFRCSEDASQASFSQYANYLRDWLSGGFDLPPFPRINLAVMNENCAQRRRITTIASPASAKEARHSVSDRFGPIIGGVGSSGAYKGDAYLDRDEAWHLANEAPERNRRPGDDILVVLYKLDPNYVGRRVFGGEGGSLKPSTRKSVEVRLEPGDPYYVNPEGKPLEEHAVITFAAWTPLGGPMYEVKTNSLIDVDGVLQRGRNQVQKDGNDSEN